MPLELSAALLIFLAVAMWKLVRRRGSTRREPFPDVADAPRSAEPIGVRMIGDGLGTYWLDVSATDDGVATERRLSD